MSIDNIRKKITALLKKNEENGSTEDEAIAAMAFAKKLMEEHGITLDDIKNNNEAATDFDEKTVTDSRKNLHEVDLYGILVNIAKFTDTHTHIVRGKNGANVYFFGYRSDIELAEYLREVCKRALETEWTKYVQNNYIQGHKRTARKSFMIGMSVRVSQRLKDMKEEYINETTGTELVVLKNQLVTKAFADKNMKLKSANRTTFRKDNNYNSGYKAGDNVQLSKSMAKNVSTGPKLIAG